MAVRCSITYLDEWVPALGVQNGYQFVRLGSRYNSLDDERHKKEPSTHLRITTSFFDFSQLLKLYEFFGLVESFYGNSIFVPLAPKRLMRFCDGNRTAG